MKDCNCNASTFNSTGLYNYTNGKIILPGTDSAFSLGIVFTSLIEFDENAYSKAADGLNISVVCDPEEDTTTYRSIDFADFEWRYHYENETFVGSYPKDAGYSNQTRFTIRVSSS